MNQQINLYQISGARSGDKGANSNVGVYFYDKKIYEWAKVNITEKMVKSFLNHFVKGKVTRYELNNVCALNFILHDSLGGGGSETLINDAQGKTHAQALLKMNISIPGELLKNVDK